MAKAKKTETGRHEWNSENEVGLFLAALIAMTGAKTVLEIGVFQGETSRHMIDALPKGGYYAGIDIEDLRTEENKILFESKGKAVDFILGNSITEIPKLTPAHFDLVFVDSAHHWAHIMPEWKQAEHVIAPGGIIAYHDSLHMGDVGRLMDYAAHYGYKRIDLKTPEGRGITLLKR